MKNWQNKNFDGVSFNVVDLMKNALDRTLEQDGDILQRGRSERLFSNRLACNLQVLLDKVLGEKNILRADSPYNKHSDDTKRISGHPIEVDLAIHQRGIDDHNVLVAEIETNNSPVGDDIWKIEEMTKKNGEYGYQAGFYLVLGIEGRAGEVLSQKWYINGSEVK